MRRHIAAWCIVALGIVAVAACANGSTSASSAPSSNPSGGIVANPSTGGPTQAPSPSMPPRKAAPPTSAPTAVKPVKPIEPIGPQSTGVMTLTGTVFAGAEPSCLLLMQGRTAYLLQPEKPGSLRAGQRVVVTGHLATRNMMSHCMQGKPFIVTSVDRLSPNGD